MKIHLITLGCPKNTADSEILLYQLKTNGFKIVSSPLNSDYVIINTCCFIKDAKIESIDTILEMVQLKNHGIIKNIFVLGCLYDRYKDELKKEITEVDGFFSYNDLNSLLKKLSVKNIPKNLYDHSLITPSHYAYLKISDGCDHSCSFCSIPMIKGKYKSKTIPNIIKEVNSLVDQKVKEIILVAQDTTYYGKDIYGKVDLAKLLRKIVKIDKLKWLRLMYAYPSNFPEEILDIILENRNFCKYIDLPIQHISDKILKSMRRGISRKMTEKLIMKLRDKIPDISIRTTLIVGFPGETRKEFDELHQFISDIKFERLGVFGYSKEESTLAYKLADRTTEKEKNERKSIIMETQRLISYENNRTKLTKKFNVLIDKVDKNHYYGRTEFDAPDIDNNVILKKSDCDHNLLPGKFYDCEIIGFSDYDLFAKPVKVRVT